MFLPSQLGFNPQTIRARSILSSPRFLDLDRRYNYFRAKQWDQRGYDFDGRPVTKGDGYLTWSSAPSPVDKAPFHVPLRQRRPSAVYRLPRAIVRAFTEMLFSEKRFPTFRVPGSTTTEHFVESLAKVSKLRKKMILARNIGGSQGTVGLSWGFVDGKPRVSVHQGKNLVVHEWRDRENLIPAHVSEILNYCEDKFDTERMQYTREWWWYRRDWTEMEDVVFKPQKMVNDREPEWIPDDTQWIRHNDGICHFEWIQNLPNDESVDGICDYEGSFENFDTLDTMLSVIARGAVLNLDPTVKLKMKIEDVARMGLRKGSDNAIVTGVDGDASYMELGGTSLTAGIELFNSLRRNTLETCGCVLPDPDEIAAAGISSVAIRAIYAPMTDGVDTRKTQYGEAMERVLLNMLRVARARWNVPVRVVDPEGNEDQVIFTLDLPPRIEKRTEVDAGPPSPLDAQMEPDPMQEAPVPSAHEDEEFDRIEQEPGDGEQIETTWGPDFLPTPDDLQKMATTFTTANGGVPIMSAQTSVEQWASYQGLDPSEEWRRTAEDKKKNDAQQAAMMPPGMGGPPGMGMPPGMGPPGGPPPPGGDPNADPNAPPDDEQPPPFGM